MTYLLVIAVKLLFSPELLAFDYRRPCLPRNKLPVCGTGNISDKTLGFT